MSGECGSGPGFLKDVEITEANDEARAIRPDAKGKNPMAAEAPVALQEDNLLADTARTAEPGDRRHLSVETHEPYYRLGVRRIAEAHAEHRSRRGRSLRRRARITCRMIFAK